MLRLLNQAINDSGIPQVEIAAKLNRPRAYVSKVLNGHQTLTLIEIRNICRAANISFIDFVSAVDAVLDEQEK